MSGEYQIDIAAFEFLSKLCEHQEVKDNYYKLKEVKKALNENRIKNKKEKEAKKKVPIKPMYSSNRQD